MQLLIDTAQAEEKKEAYKQLYQWQFICFKAANYIATHLYLQEQVKELIYLTDGTKVRLSDITRDEDGILTTSRMNSTYRILSMNFRGQIPTRILSCLNSQVKSVFEHEKSGYFSGTRSVRNYKRNIPIPFPGDAIKLSDIREDGRMLYLNFYGIPLRTLPLKEEDDKLTLLHQLYNKKIQLRGSNIQLDNGRIYLLAAFEHAQDQHGLNTDTIAYAELSAEVPIAVTIHSSRYTVGNQEEFLHRRHAFQRSLQRLQRGASYTHGGHGCERKLKHIHRFRNAEKAYIDQKLHAYSKRLIDLCIEHKAGKLILKTSTVQESKTAENDLLLRHWNYGSFKEKIAYKANKAGITVVAI